MRLLPYFLLLAACGASAPSDDADAGKPPPPFTTADHPPPPSVVSLGGDILASPTIVPIVFASDADRAQVEAFTAAVGSTSHWADTMAEYGIDAATVAAPIEVNDAAPATIDDPGIRTWLGSELTTPDPSAIYTIFYPAGTTVIQGGPSCISWAGYHDELVIGSTRIAYAVIPRCTGFHFAFDTGQGLDVTTAAAFHEWVEAATDPHPNTAPGYQITDLPHISWMAFPGSEIADMCASTSGAQTTPSDVPGAIQRIWSNAAAAAGHDPCVPHVSSQPYFNSAPVLPDKLTLGSGASAVKDALGVHIPIGQSKTIEVDLFSDAPTSGPWDVAAFDFNTYYKVGPAELEFAWDTNSGSNGDKLHLTITAKLVDKNFGAAPFAIVSTLGDETTTWFGIVGN